MSHYFSAFFKPVINIFLIRAFFSSGHICGDDAVMIPQKGLNLQSIMFGRSKWFLSFMKSKTMMHRFCHYKGLILQYHKKMNENIWSPYGTIFLLVQWELRCLMFDVWGLKDHADGTVHTYRPTCCTAASVDSFSQLWKVAMVLRVSWTDINKEYQIRG